ncbi:MAG: GtrA family protein [Actinomycetota bacterium]|nr:GtrA family protein [Actinomycetota bacterium]
MPTATGPRRALAEAADKARLIRYGAVSCVNIVGHQLILTIANSVMGVPGGPANAIAATIMCVPAYLLSRNWVWEVDGKHSVTGQVLPFWIITVVGLLVSTALAALAQSLFGKGLAVNAAAFLGYFLVWVMKFFVLERLFGRVAGS